MEQPNNLTTKDKTNLDDVDNLVTSDEPSLSFEAAQQYEKLVQKVEVHLDWCRGSRDRRDSENRWTDAQNFWLGRQWDGIKSVGVPGRSAEEKKLHANPVDNFVKAFVEGIVGDVCDRPCDIQVKSRSDEDETYATTYSTVAQYLWYANRGDRKLEFAVRRGVLYGPLIVKVCWDEEWKTSAESPFSGDVRFFGVLPTSIFIDPRVHATEEGAIQSAAFIAYGVRRSLAYIKERYPENGHRVSADAYASYVTALTHDEETDVYVEDNEALLIEYWYKGEPLAPEFPATEVPPEVRQGWVHKAVVAGGILLEHRTYVYPWHPFVMEWVYPSDESIYCYGDAYDTLIPQLILNKLTELSIEGAALQSYGNWVTEEGNIRNKEQFQRYAGMGNSVLSVTDKGRTERVFGGNVPSTLFVHYRQALQNLETVCGRQDVVQGRSPRNIQAASAIALLLQQAGGRIRQRSRAVASFVEQTVRMALHLVTIYYTEERILRVKGKDGKYTSLAVSQDKLVKTRDIYDLETGGVQSTEAYIPEFDVIVTAGAETPTSKAYYSELAQHLFRMGQIDSEALLDTIQFPRWREIMQRMKEAKEPPAPDLTTATQPAPTPQGGAPLEFGQQSLIPPELAALLGGEAMQENPYAHIGGAAPAGPQSLLQGFPPQGVQPQGFPPQGAQPQGFPPQGMQPQDVQAQDVYQLLAILQALQSR